MGHAPRFAAADLERPNTAKPRIDAMDGLETARGKATELYKQDPIVETLGPKYVRPKAGGVCPLGERTMPREKRDEQRSLKRRKAKQHQAMNDQVHPSHVLADGHQHVGRHEVGVLRDLVRILGLDGAQLVHVDEVHAGDLFGQLPLPAWRTSVRYKNS